MESSKVSNLSELIKFTAGQYKDAVAYRWKQKKEIIEKSFMDLSKDSMAASRMLDAWNMTDAHVAIVGTTSYEWICSYFGVVNAGGVAVPIDPLLPADDICELLDRADVSAIIYDEIRKDLVAPIKEKCKSITKIISMQGNDEDTLSLPELLAENAGEYNKDIDSDQLCTILFTSGTTGKSKGVMLSHRNLSDNATCQDMGINPGTVAMTVLPINHVYCLTMDIIKGMYSGCTMCINDSIMHLQKNLMLFQPEIVLMVPMMIQSIYKKLKAAPEGAPKALVAQKALGGKLRTIYSGGAYLDQMYIDEFKEYGINILQGYGMSECSPVISTSKEDDVVAHSVGALVPNCQAKIVDDEIWVRGSSVMLGYYKMPEETKETLTEDGWLKTGDLGYIDDNNHIFITGRKKNLIILANGENVSPEELENTLSNEDIIAELIVRADAGLIEAVIFPDAEYVATNNITDIQAALLQVIDKVNEKQPVYKRIQKITIRETEFEKTTSKKIKRY